MNREEILNMPAGKNIDRLIAEKLMGWVWDKYKRVYRIDLKDNSLFGVGWGDDDAPNGYFEPSADISAAWEVAEIFGYYKIERLGKAYNVYIENDDNVRTGISQGDDLPLAICRAALLAVMERENE